MKTFLSIALSFFCVLTISQAQSLNAPAPSNVILDYIATEDVQTVFDQFVSATAAKAMVMAAGPADCLCLGDINRDGNVNLLDVGPFVEAVENGINDPCADMNQDGVVNLLDVAPFVKEIESGGCND